MLPACGVVPLHATVYDATMSDASPAWDADRIRALRERLGLSQRQLADELGVRQQTVSEWETGVYRPRGASLRVLRMVAERAPIPYAAEAPGALAVEHPTSGEAAGSPPERAGEKPARDGH